MHALHLRSRHCQRDTGTTAQPPTAACLAHGVPTIEAQPESRLHTAMMLPAEFRPVVLAFGQAAVLASRTRSLLGMPTAAPGARPSAQAIRHM